MIDFNNISQNNWADTRISILGAGKSGISAGVLGAHVGANIFISENDNSPEIIKNIGDFKHEVGGHSNTVLDADFLVKSPGYTYKCTINFNICLTFRHRKGLS